MYKEVKAILNKYNIGSHTQFNLALRCISGRNTKDHDILYNNFLRLQKKYPAILCVIASTDTQRHAPSCWLTRENADAAARGLLKEYCVQPEVWSLTLTQGLAVEHVLGLMMQAEAEV